MTTIVIDAGVAHWPAVGVKLYVVVVVLLTVAGNQFPAMPLLEMDGKTGTADPLQIAATWVNTGITLAFTVTVSVFVVAHCPADGVKVYVAVLVLLTVAGDHVPVIPSNEIVGKTGAAEPLQMAGIAENVGKISFVTFTVAVAVAGHPQELVTVKVYVVELAGQAVGFRIFVADNPAAGAQEYVYVFSFAKVIDQLFSVPISPAA